MNAMSKPTLNDLTAFVTVATCRSFRAAADELGVAASSLSHTLRSLEDQLGVRLLNRTTRSVAPTEAGERLLARVVPLLREFDAALADIDVFRDEPGGTVRINAPPTAAQLLLREVVPRFRQRYPQVAIDIVTEGRFVDIVAEGFDAGVRLGEAVPQDMIAVAFGGPARFVAVAAPAYLARAGSPLAPDDLRRHDCIRHRMPSGKLYRWEFQRRGQDVVIEVPGKLTLDHLDLMLAAAVDGHGIAYIPYSLAAAQVREGQLTMVLEDWCPRYRDCFYTIPATGRCLPACGP